MYFFLAYCIFIVSYYVTLSKLSGRQEVLLAAPGICIIISWPGVRDVKSEQWNKADKDIV